MSTMAWIILILVFSGASFFMAAALCVSNRDVELANAYKRGLKEGLRKSNPEDGRSNLGPDAQANS